jgi:hypothetical protein
MILEFRKFFEDAIDTKAVLAASNVQNYIQELKSLGVRVFNFYNLIEATKKNPEKYQNGVVLGLRGEYMVTHLIAKLTNSQNWNDFPANTPPSKTALFIKEIFDNGRLLYFVLPPAMEQMDKIIKHNPPSFNERPDPYNPKWLYPSGTGYTDLEFKEIYKQVKENPQYAKQVIFIVGSHNALNQDDLKHLQQSYPSIWKDEAPEYLKNWKSHLSTNPATTNTGNIGAII